VLVHEVSRTFAADLRSVGDARKFLREVMAQWETDDYDMTAAQVLTELATNAALHARSDYTVHLRLDPESLLVEVTDSSPAWPQQRHYGRDATTGRGIAMVEALSTVWGVQASPTGKTVWCRVAPDDQVGLDAESDQEYQSGSAVIDVPVTRPARRRQVDRPTLAAA
jgi:anti-sigma regulatory factor (Ser/Thr protein kinase)